MYFFTKRQSKKWSKGSFCDMADDPHKVIGGSMM